MNFNTDNLLCFHLNLFNNFEQVLKMINDRELFELDPYKIWDSKMDGKLKIWLDRDTHEIIFWTQKGDRKGTLCINSTYLSAVHNLKSICYDRKVKKTITIEESNDSSFNYGEELNQSVLNLILDKILSQGVDALNEKEKNFLKKFSN